MSAFTKAHRVVIGTADAVDPHDATAFNGYLFKETTGTPGVRPYPFALTQLEMKEFRDRIYTWNLNTDADAGGVGFANAPMTPAQTVERDLARNIQTEFGASATSGTGSVSLVLFGSGFLLDGADYYPSLSLSGNVNDGGGNSIAFHDDPADGTVNPPDGSFTASIWGKNFTLYYKAIGGGTISSLILTVPATSGYWPYCAKGETPIYNVDTGAQLQSPTN